MHLFRAKSLLVFPACVMERVSSVSTFKPSWVLFITPGDTRGVVRVDGKKKLCNLKARFFQIQKGHARPMISTTLLRLGTRPSGNLPTQRLITASSTGIQARPSCVSGHALRGTSRRNGSSRPARQASKHDPPAPRDTPFGEPPNATAHHGQLDRQPSTTLLKTTLQSYTSGHALRRTSIMYRK